MSGKKDRLGKEYAKVCALCEYSCYLEIDGTYICKYKDGFLKVAEDYSCRHFSFDLLKLEPRPRKIRLSDE